jgi:hypothetical protein
VPDGRPSWLQRCVTVTRYFYGSGSDFWHGTVPDPVPDPYLVPRLLITVFKKNIFFIL